MEDWKKGLKLDDMAQVSGGLVVDNGTGDKYWIIRQDGTVIGPAPNLTDAVSFAKSFSVSTEVITLEEYKTRFGRDLVW